MGEVRFQFQGALSASKSLFNRALIVQSYFPQLKIQGESQADDVKKMRQALLQLQTGSNEPFDCGAAGTTLRFLLTRLSREQGTFYLTGDERLFSRPHRELTDSLSLLGVKVDQPEKNFLRVRSEGWVVPERLSVDCSRSSQFASSLLLNSWKLKEPLRLTLSEKKVSLAYFGMTLNLMKELGLEFEIYKSELVIPPGQSIHKTNYVVEPDMSSIFTIASFAASAGGAEFRDFPLASLQPDARFMRLFKKMGISLEFTGGSLKITEPSELKAVDCNLSDTPDLFPVLAVLLSQASGRSVITGIAHLAFKESNRIENTLSLLKSLNRKASYERGRFIIEGKKEAFQTDNLAFDSDKDHRMAMAAALAKQLGADIEVKTPEVVEKSFPEFWDILKESEISS